jgi:hypothetical protein
MNIEYLKKEIIPQRKKEIEEGKNAATAKPIYVVLDLIENCVSGHSEYTVSTNYKEIPMQHGYIDVALDSDEREFCTEDIKMQSPEKLTRFYTDRIVAFFLTSKAAHEYLHYQKHNLSERAYVYVFYAGYRNIEMYNLLENE